VTRVALGDVAPNQFVADVTSQECERSVLLVEDDAIVALDLEQALRRLGYGIAGHAVSGEEAVEIAQRNPPDLLLMDVDLPGAIDGIEAARRIRTALDIPVIFLTGHSDSRTLARAMSAEPFGYLVKPFHARDLKCAMEVAIHKHRRELAMRRRNERLARQSLLDELTGVANRRGFFAFAEPALTVARRNGEQLALFFADLDGLKAINDSHGHSAGDRALQEAARLLRITFRDSDVVGRVGGDEFLVLARLAHPEDVAILRQRVGDAFAEFNRSNVLPFEIALSIGAVTVDSQATSVIETLVASADEAMYAEKKARWDSEPAPPDRRIRR